jgi:carboxyl-terminal processing protease
VYDGAGVMPDIKTEEQHFENILISLISKYHIFNYATQYALKHPTIAPVKDFHLSESEYQAFIDFLKDKDYTYKTRSENDLETLKKTAEEEHYFDNLSAEYAALVKRMADNKKDDLSKYKSSIKQYLEEEIVARYYFQTGRIEHSLRDDEDLAEALRLLGDQSGFKKLLTTSAAATKPFNPKKKF